jgi:hypothetical protein
MTPSPLACPLPPPAGEGSRRRRVGEGAVPYGNPSWSFGEPKTNCLERALRKVDTGFPDRPLATVIELQFDLGNIFGR